MAHCESSYIKTQIGGTCWFHSILNGWLLSGRGRLIMKRMLNAYKQTANYKRYASINSCPMRGKLPLNYFWHYVDHMLKPASSRLNLNFHNARIIQNIGLRNIKNVVPNINFRREFARLELNRVNNLNKTVKTINNIRALQKLSNEELTQKGFKKIPRLVFREASKTQYSYSNRLNKEVLYQYLNRITSGGFGVLDKTKFNDIVFPDLWTDIYIGVDKPILEQWSIPAEVKHIEKRIGNYELSHCYLVIRSSDKKRAHAICGYICSDGKEYIYNSATNTNDQINWTTVSNIEKFINMYKIDYDGWYFDSVSSTPTYIVVPSKAVAPKINNTPKPVAPKINKTPKPVAPKINNTPKPVAPKINNTPKPVAPKINNTPKPVVSKVNKNTSTREKNSKGRNIYIGPKGGRYVFINAAKTKKSYVK
jgi:hypothetical protein